MFDWLLCFVLRETAEKQSKLLEQGVDQFTTKNETQVFLCKTMSTIFMEVRSIYIFFFF